MSIDSLFAEAYEELRLIARQRLRGEHVATLNPTALVHEAFLKLRSSRRVAEGDRSAFLAAASVAMHRLLVDLARARRAGKRRHERADVTISGLPDGAGCLSFAQLLSLDEALTQLAERGTRGARQARLIEYVWLGGLTFEEAAAQLQITERTAFRDWAYARTWLQTRLDR